MYPFSKKFKNKNLYSNLIIGEDQMEISNTPSEDFLKSSQKVIPKSLIFGSISILLVSISLIIQLILNLYSYYNDDGFDVITILILLITFLSIYGSGLVLGIFGTYSSKKENRAENPSRNQRFGFFLPRIGLIFNTAGVFVWILIYIDYHSSLFLYGFIYFIIITLLIVPACYYFIKAISEKPKMVENSNIFIIGIAILGITIPFIRFIVYYLTTINVTFHDFELMRLIDNSIYTLMMLENIIYLIVIGISFIIIGKNYLTKFNNNYLLLSGIITTTHYASLAILNALILMHDYIYMLTGYYIKPVLSFSFEAIILRCIIKDTISLIIINIGYGFGIAHSILDKHDYLTISLVLINCFNSFLFVNSIIGSVNILIFHT